MRLIQYIVVLLNFSPFTRLFRCVYDLGLKCLLNSLARRDGVYSVFGYGSFFERRCLYGVSDIDLVLVMKKGVSRSSAEYNEVALLYNRVRRFFPFLQHWYELDENLIFLSEIHSNEALPESFKLRLKRGDLYLLEGESVFQELAAADVSLNEIVSEANSLLRLVLMKGDRHTRSLLFWKKNFLKLFALIEEAGLGHLKEENRVKQELEFLGSSDATLFFRTAPLNDLFGAFLGLSQAICRAIKEHEEQVHVAWENHNRGGIRAVGITPEVTCGEAQILGTNSQLEEASPRTVPSSVAGVAPRRDYFPVDTMINVVRLEDNHYETIRRQKDALERGSGNGESLLIQASELLLVMSKYPSYVDIVPLDPIICANIHALVFQGKNAFDMPASIYKKQRAKAESMFASQTELYRENDGWIKTLPFPCLYVEDDLEVIQDAFHRMRVYLLHSDGVDIGSSCGLTEYLGRKYPACREFLDDLFEYYRYLDGHRNGGRFANNLYRCLHQFMAQLLSGSKDISVDDHRKHLGITVGIITRDRAEDLKELLESLACQIRPADEIVIVDNGSSDQTGLIIEEYQRRLPISSHFLAEASIPAARNMVIKNASHEIISFTDDDCIVDSQWLVSVERGFLRADNIGIVGGWVKHASNSEESIIDTYYSVFHHNKP